MDFFEDIVFYYATTKLSADLNCKLLIHPQFRVEKDLQGNKREAVIDFIFVNLNTS